MAKGLGNPAFPHTCIVRRMKEVTPFSDGVSKTIYEGPCRRETSSNIRTFKQGTSSVGQIVNVDYRVSIPGRWPIRKGDIVSVDFGIGENENGIVTQPNTSGLKTPDFPEGRTEFYYSLPEV